LYSEVGVGTTFRLYLPRDVGLVQPAADDAMVGAPRGNGETILVVEDNPGLRRTVVRQIEQLGYRVEQAENGTDAMAVLEGPGTIDLVFTDVVLAGSADGFDLATAIVGRWPHIKILMTSGFPGDRHHPDDASFPVRLLSKPFL